MKKTKFTDAQIVFALKQAETGTRVEEVCRKMGISEATFYNWKEKIEIWRQDYNEYRPHSSIGDITPAEFLKQYQISPKSLL